MSAQRSSNFLIPEISCQQDFEIVASYGDGAREKVLNCDWSETDYDCRSAPGFIYNIEKDHTLITVQKKLKENFEKFICVVLGQPGIYPSSCHCREEAITRGEPDSDHPRWLIGLYLVLGVCALGLLICIIVFRDRFYQWCCRK